MRGHEGGFGGSPAAMPPRWGGVPRTGRVHRGITRRTRGSHEGHGERRRLQRVASGEWRVASGEWRVESGEWRVESGDLGARIEAAEMPIKSFRLQSLSGPAVTRRALRVSFAP